MADRVFHPSIAAGIAIASAGVIGVCSAEQQALEVQRQVPDVRLPAVALTSGSDLTPLGTAVTDALGLQSVTLNDLVSGLGLSPDNLMTLLTSMVNALGLGSATLGGLVNDVGLGNESLNTLLSSLVGPLGLNNVTLGDLVAALGLNGNGVMPLLTNAVNALGLGSDTLDSLVSDLGVGGNAGQLLQSLTPLVTALGQNTLTFGDLVDALDLQNVSITTLITALGGSPPACLGTELSLVGANTVGGALSYLGLANVSVFPGLVSLTTDTNLAISSLSVVDILNNFGLGDKTVDDLLSGLGGVTLFKDMSVGALLSDLGLSDVTLGHLLTSGLIPDTATVGDLLTGLGLSTTTVDSLLSGLSTVAIFDNMTVSDLLSDLGIGGVSLINFVSSLVLGSNNTAAAAASQALATLEASSQAIAGVDLPTLAPEYQDAFLNLVQKIDGYAFTPVGTDEFENHDIIGTIAMQINQGTEADMKPAYLGLNLVSIQLLYHDYKALLPITTNFFEEFVTKMINPDAFTSTGLPTDPNMWYEVLAYQADNLLANTVYAGDLNVAGDVLFGP